MSVIDVVARRNWHTATYLVLALFLLLLNCFGANVSDKLQIFMLVGLVALLGVPHGALDPLVAHATGIARTSQMLGFLTFYLLQAVAMLLMWYLLPVGALIFFLLISIVHFSGDWKNEASGWLRLAAAATIIGAPPLFHPQETARIFSVLIPAEAVSAITMVLQVLAVLSIGILIIGLTITVRHSWLNTAELASLPLLAWALPPIPFFVAYFCGLHSPRHFLETIGQLAIRPDIILAVTVGITLVTCSLCAAAFMFLPAVTVDARLKQIVFVGLAALTVPHMLLMRQVESSRTRRG